jgi:dolichol-phosphate mannosyltransferase
MSDGVDIARLLSPRILRFLAVGFTGVFVNLGALYVLYGVFAVSQVVSSPIAIEVSIIWNFLLNNAWTFRDKNDGASAGFGERLIRYNAASLIGLAIQFGTSLSITNLAMRALSLTDPGIWTYLSQLAGIAIGTGWNFISNCFWTWAPSKAHEAERP